MRKLNVLFVNPPPLPYRQYFGTSDGTGGHYVQKAMPLGILHLASQIKARCPVDRVACLDFVGNLESLGRLGNLEKFVEDTARRIDFVPDVIAWSLIFSTTHQFFVEVAPLLKARWPGAVGIAGGNHPTNGTAQLIALNSVEYYVRGEGDIALVDFLNQLAAGRPISVTGVYDAAKFAAEGGKAAEKGQMPENLDELPLPDWGILDMEAYTTGSINRKRDFGSAAGVRCASIMTSRGCPFHCTFCGSHTVHGRAMRYRSTEQVLAEIKTLYEEYGVTLFIPEDDLFTVNKKRVIALLGAIRDLGIPGMEVQFPNALSVNTLDEDVIDALIGVGMRIATLAVESGSTFVQQNMIKKRCDLDHAVKMVRYIRSKGLYCRCYYILGFPGETRELMEETIRFASDLRSDWSVFNIAVPLLGSEMYHQFSEMGAIEDGEKVWSSIYYKREFDTPEISAREINDLQYRANLTVNFLNNVLVQEGRYDDAIKVFADILRSYPFHVFAHHMIAECHKRAGRPDAAAEQMSALRRVIAEDDRALDQLTRFGDLVPALKALERGRLPLAASA